MAGQTAPRDATGYGCLLTGAGPGIPPRYWRRRGPPRRSRRDLRQCSPAAALSIAKSGRPAARSWFTHGPVRFAYPIVANPKPGPNRTFTSRRRAADFGFFLPRHRAVRTRGRTGGGSIDANGDRAQVGCLYARGRDRVVVASSQSSAPVVNRLNSNPSAGCRSNKHCRARREP